MRIHAFEIIIGLLVTVGAALVLATGYLSYKSISSIVASIHEENLPDEKLSLISDIATSLEKAENSVRLYAYTKSNSDLKPYRDLINNIDDQLSELYDYAEGNDQYQKNIDTITLLIGQKVEVWNDMLTLSNTTVARQYLDTISEQLESKVESDSLRKKRGLFKKIFKRQKKQEIDEEKIIRDIEQVREEDKQQSLKVREKELKLAQTSSQLTEKLYHLIYKLKADERKERLARAENADEMAIQTYGWIGWFSLSATLLALLVIFVIVAYVRKMRKTQKALAASKAEAENLARTKELFVANVSHEIRTPLNVISGFVDQLLRKPLENKLATTLNIIKSSTDHLVRIINDVLDFSKLESGKMKLDPVHFRMRDLLDETGMLFESKAAEAQTEFRIVAGEGLPEVLFADPIRLKQIIINLVSNAIKFTKNGRVTLELNAENKKDTKFVLVLIVEDNGIGIDKNNLAKIFEDFTQAESGTSRKFGGTGLGLSIVKKLVDLLGGSIQVESDLHKGTRFTCILPCETGLENEVEEIQAGEPEVPDEIRTMKVLVVDDETYNRMLMKTILNKWKVEADEAEDGNRAMEMLSKKNYDFILLDIQMPGPDGFEITRHIRKSLKLDTGQTAVIITTATAVSKEEFKKFRSMGVDAYLPKPFTEEMLLKTMTGIMEKKRKPGGMLNKQESLITVNGHKTGNENNIVNLEELHRFAGGDEAFVREMLEKFIESFENGMSKIKGALKTDDLIVISNTAHKMASPIRHIGAGHLLENIKKTEHLAEINTSGDKIRPVIEQAELNYKAVKEVIDKHLEKLKI